MSSNFWISKEQVGPTSFDASAATTIVYAPGEEIFLDRITLNTLIAQTVANAVITVGVRNIDDSSSVSKGTFTLPFTGSVVNQRQFVNLIEPATAGVVSPIDGSLVYTTEGKGPIKVLPGQEVFMTSDAGGNAGTYNVYFSILKNGYNEEVDGAELTFTAV